MGEDEAVVASPSWMQIIMRVYVICTSCDPLLCKILIKVMYTQCTLYENDCSTFHFPVSLCSHES